MSLELSLQQRNGKGVPAQAPELVHFMPVPAPSALRSPI